jgi:hypothetical protein
LDNPAPTDLEVALSADWLSQALRRPAAPVQVGSVKIVETFKSTATKVRFEVAFDAAPPGTGSALCIKGFFGGGALVGGGVAGRTEASFYQDMRPHSKTRTAVCRYVGIDRQTGHGLIVMDDIVAAGGRFLTALEPYTLDQAAGSLDQLALLHSEHWSGATLQRYSWLRRPLDDMARTPWLSVAALQELMDSERGTPLSPATRDATRIQGAISALAALGASRSECLVHGDAHAGNIFEMAGAQSLIDWQLLQRGMWALDVPYHLAATLSVEDRRKSEKDLLRHYLDRLRAYGVDPPDWDRAWSDYRAYVVYGFFLWAMTRRVAPAITHEFVKRLGSAVADLESFQLLGV